jgi:DNA-binding MarR family transcriptional regulator
MVSTTTLAELRYLILAAQRHGSRMLADALRAANLTPAQAEVLDVLARHAPLTLAELGRLLVCEAGSPSRLVDSLVQRGLVARTPGEEDRRVVTLRLTRDGTEAAAHRSTPSPIDGYITDRLTPAEIATLTRLLHKLLDQTPGGDAVRTRFPRERAQRKAK